jgi:hypothetical protein
MLKGFFGLGGLNRLNGLDSLGRRHCFSKCTLVGVDNTYRHVNYYKQKV